MGIRAVMWQFCTRWVSEGIFGRQSSQRQCIWSSDFLGFMYIRYFMLAILPTIIGGYPRCGLCIANNGVANCIELVVAPCIRILNHGAEDVRDILVGRCGQKVDPAKMAILTKFNGKRCNCTALLCSQRIFIWWFMIIDIERKKMFKKCSFSITLGVGFFLA